MGSLLIKQKFMGKLLIKQQVMGSLFIKLLLYQLTTHELLFDN
jgi:hypothetical protein